MASFTLRRPDVFPDGTTVGVYPASIFSGRARSGEPPATALSSGTVSGDAVTFSGLTEEAQYIAGADVGGTWRYIGFAVSSSGSVESTNRLKSYVANPDSLITGAITRDTNGAATSASVVWPDGATGTYTGTASTSFPGAVDSYTITHVLNGTTTTYTQPAVTRDANGAVTTRPAITVA